MAAGGNRNHLAAVDRRTKGATRTAASPQAPTSRRDPQSGTWPGQIQPMSEKERAMNMRGTMSPRRRLPVRAIDAAITGMIEAARLVQEFRGQQRARWWGTPLLHRDVRRARTLSTGVRTWSERRTFRHQPKAHVALRKSVDSQTARHHAQTGYGPESGVRPALTCAFRPIILPVFNLPCLAVIWSRKRT